MKKHQRKLNRATLSLGDLVMAVSACTENPAERAAAINDLLERGRVRLAPPLRRRSNRF